MDVIWKNLSDNHPSCKRLSLYSQSDPGTGATFAVRCNSLMGVTSEENFLNDAMYLVEGVLPLNETLQTVEMEWSFLNHLEEEDRDNFIRGVSSLKNLEEISIRGSMTEESRMRFRSLLQIPECAKKLKHLAIEVDELHVEDPAEIGLAALLVLRCQRLESFHIRGLMPVPATDTITQAHAEFDCSILLSALGKLPNLHTVHISRNQENPKTICTSALRDVCSLPLLQSLSLMNMGLNDKHCKIFKKSLYNSKHLHSLILVDNPSITEKGNKALLRLLEKNRSIYNSTFGTDSETIHRTSQLVHLHLNRCGRSKVQSPTSLPLWLDYLSKINETVPEELELDTLFVAVQENPEMIIQQCFQRNEHVYDLRFQQKVIVTEAYLEPVSVATAILEEEEEDASENNEEMTTMAVSSVVAASTQQQQLQQTPKKLPTRKDIAVLNTWGESPPVFPPLLTSQSLDSSIMSPTPYHYHQSQQPLPLQELDHLVQRWQLEASNRLQHTSRRQSMLPQKDIVPHSEGDAAENNDGINSDRQTTVLKCNSDCNPSDSSFGKKSDEANPSTINHTSKLTQRQRSRDSSWDVTEGLAELERVTNDIFHRLLNESCWTSSLEGVREGTQPVHSRSLVV